MVVLSVHDYQRAYFIEQLNTLFGYTIDQLNKMSLNDLKYTFYKESVGP